MTESSHHPADKKALALMRESSPRWVSVDKAKDVVKMSGRILLHAGPPVDLQNIAAPILNSAIMATLFEGWTDSQKEAKQQIVEGKIVLLPAQDANVAVPLASVLSPNMAVQTVEDQGIYARQSFAPLNGGMVAPLRLGLCNEDVLKHLRWLNGEFSEVLSESLVSPISLIPIADAALKEGDDCHGRTIKASEILTEKLMPNIPQSDSGLRAKDYLYASPPFFLNLWMAGVKNILMSASDISESSVVCAIGGNGVECGLQLSGKPGVWFTAPATPPIGDIGDGISSEDRCGAIGDSAIIDAFGLGAMAFHYAPLQMDALGKFMDIDSSELSDLILGEGHPEFTVDGFNSGLTARRITKTNQSLSISLGILDRLGERGRIGGGVYSPPIELFEEACSALQPAGENELI